MANREEYLSKYNEWCESLKEDSLDERFIRSILLDEKKVDDNTVVDAKELLNCYSDIIKSIKNEISEIRKNIFLEYTKLNSIKYDADIMIQLHDKNANTQNKHIIEQLDESYDRALKNITEGIDTFNENINSFTDRLKVLNYSLEHAELIYKTLFDKIYPDTPETDNDGIPKPSYIMGVLTT